MIDKFKVGDLVFIVEHGIGDVSHTLDRIVSISEKRGDIRLEKRKSLVFEKYGRLKGRERWNFSKIILATDELREQVRATNLRRSQLRYLKEYNFDSLDSAGLAAVVDTLKAIDLQKTTESSKTNG